MRDKVTPIRSELAEQLQASLDELAARDTERPPETERVPDDESDQYHEARQRFRQERTLRPWSTLSEFQKTRVAIGEIDRRVEIGADRELWLFVRQTLIAGLPRLVRDMLRNQGDI